MGVSLGCSADDGSTPTAEVPVFFVPKGDNSFCGPYALAIILQCSTDQAARMIREARGYGTAVKSAHDHELEKVLRTSSDKRLVGMKGWVRKQRRYPDPTYPGGTILKWAGPTLAAWAKMTAQDRGLKTCLVQVTGHFVIVKGRLMTCSQNRQWIPIVGSSMARRQVVAGYSVEDAS